MEDGTARGLEALAAHLNENAARAEVRRCWWLLAWVVLFLIAGMLLVLDADWMAATFDGRHLLLCASVIGVAFCAEPAR